MRVAYIIPKHDEEKIYQINYDPNKTIRDLKKRIKNEYGIPEYCQKLYINTIELLDDKQLSFYGQSEKIDLFNMHELRAIVRLKNKPIEYILKACDSIFNVKEKIFKDFNIPINKILIYNSNRIVNDNALLEDFLLNLIFEVNLLNTDKIKINLTNENGNIIDTLIVDPFSYTNDIYSKVQRNYNYQLYFKSVLIDSGKLITQYNIHNGDNIEIVKCNSNKIELEVKFINKETKKVVIFPHEPLYRLLDLLNIKDKSINFSFNDNVYPISSIQTFEEIGLIKDSQILIHN